MFHFALLLPVVILVPNIQDVDGVAKNKFAFLAPALVQIQLTTPLAT